MKMPRPSWRTHELLACSAWVWVSRLTKTRVIHVSTHVKLSGKMEKSPMLVGALVMACGSKYGSPIRFAKAQY
jgi:hypothetical protein